MSNNPPAKFSDEEIQKEIFDQRSKLERELFLDMMVENRYAKQGKEKEEQKVEEN